MNNKLDNLSTESTLPKAVCDQIDEWLAKFPEDKKQSATLPALMIAQKHNGGSLNENLIGGIADYLGLTKIAVYEVATFYSLYDLSPTGKHKINICTNVSCLLTGSEAVVNHITKKLDVKMGEMTKDGKFVVKGVECLAACVNAPAMMIDDDYFEDLTPERIDQILEKY